MSKYFSKKITIDGITFDSKKEADFYCELKMLQRGKAVIDFERQVPFVLQPAYTNAQGQKIRAIKYIADFVVNYADGRQEVIDVKGFRTKEYLLKRKMLGYKFPTLIFREV